MTRIKHNLSHEEITDWIKMKKDLTPSRITDPHLLLIATTYARLTDSKVVLPCKCDGHLWKKWIAMVDRRVKEQLTALAALALKQQEDEKEAAAAAAAIAAAEAATKIEDKQGEIHEKGSQPHDPPPSDDPQVNATLAEMMILVSPPETLRTFAQWEEIHVRLQISDYGSLTPYALTRKKYSEKEFIDLVQTSTSFTYTPTPAAYKNVQEKR